MTGLSLNLLKVHLAIRKGIESGNVDDIFREIGDATDADLAYLQDFAEKQAAAMAKITAIGRKHKFKNSETAGSMLKRAAAKGDEDARRLLASDILDMRIY